MKAGDLRDRVTIQQQNRSSNGQGGYTVAWADVSDTPEVWANVIGLTGDEAIEAAVERSSNRWRVTIRARTDVTGAHRLVWNGINLDVKSVMPLPSAPREGTLLICESGRSAEGN
jgi:SPP1 family predicted phage head-tail adaptor